MTETDESDNIKQEFIYENYLDKAFVMVDYTGQTATDHYYAHDHLFSPAALLDDEGAVEEYYEYDAYGNMKVYYDAGADSTWLTADDDTDTASHHGNPIAFTGQRLDNLDSNSLFVMYYKNRYYLPDLGRFMQRDLLSLKSKLNGSHFSYAMRFYGFLNYISNSNEMNLPSLSGIDSMNSYEYVQSCPAVATDPSGLIIEIDIEAKARGFNPFRHKLTPGKAGRWASRNGLRKQCCRGLNKKGGASPSHISNPLVSQVPEAVIDYGYNQYKEAGEKGGKSLARQIGICTGLNLRDNEGCGDNLPKVVSFTRNGKKHFAMRVSQNGSCYWVAHHFERKYGWLIGEYYSKQKHDVKLGKCPAQGRSGNCD
ncbi:MAG: hypothetical protein JXD22_17320 [Sedimentisphaerales bacterium]|nr:hypothetical protein [Sedimentisphaerales bacterium]